VIAEEAGGLVTGSHDAFAATSSSNTFGDVTEDILTGRKYIVVRAIAPNPVSFPLWAHGVQMTGRIYTGGNWYRSTEEDHQGVLRMRRRCCDDLSALGR
jgi:hypothetical protein